jgi:hypothetical protein
MIFAFNGIQVKGIIHYSLKANDIFILRYIKDIMQNKKTMRTFQGRVVYYYISPKILLKQMPFLHFGIRMLETHMQYYVEKNKILLRVPRTIIYKGKTITNQFYRFDKDAFILLFSHQRTAKSCASNYAHT